MKRTIIIILAIIVLMVIFSGIYTLNEMEQAIITQFGKPVGEPITSAGLHFKMPFIQKVIVFEKRLLEWDGDPNEIPTKDNKFIRVDTFARWRISDALSFYKSVRNEIGAQSRLDDLLDGAVRDEVSNRLLVELIRNSDRPMTIYDVESTDIMMDDQNPEKTMEVPGARLEVAQTILKNVQKKLDELKLGIEVKDIEFKRIDYNLKVQDKVFSRMISEQNRIAEKYRALGQGEKQRILGEIEREKKKIISEAYKESQKIRGAADAEATRIYADAYQSDPEFYSFLKTLETYRETLDNKTSIILSTENEYLKYLESPR